MATQSHPLNHIYFPANRHHELMFTGFEPNTQQLIRESIMKHANWDSEQADLLINGNTVQLIQANFFTRDTMITDTDFINCIHFAISNHDIDPIEYRNRITTEGVDDTDTEVFTYQLLSINP